MLAHAVLRGLHGQTPRDSADRCTHRDRSPLGPSHPRHLTHLETHTLSGTHAQKPRAPAGGAGQSTTLMDPRRAEACRRAAQPLHPSSPGTSSRSLSGCAPSPHILAPCAEDRKPETAAGEAAHGQCASEQVRPLPLPSPCSPLPLSSPSLCSVEQLHPQPHWGNWSLSWKNPRCWARELCPQHPGLWVGDRWGSGPNS